LYNEQPIADTRKTISDLRSNGLLRRYFPKGTDFMTLSEEKIQLAVDNLNHKSRKTRGYKTPHKLFTGQSEILVAAKKIALIT
jgi:IS30 family transposase